MTSASVSAHIKGPKSSKKYPPQPIYFAEMLRFWYDKYKLGEKINVIVTSWIIKVDLNIIFIPDLTNVNDVLKHYDLNKYFQNDNIWKYICHKFKTQKFEDENIYQFTSAFSNALIDVVESNNNYIDGIFYPCVQYSKKSNIALRSNLVDKKYVILNEVKKIETLKNSELNEDNLPAYDFNFDRSTEINGKYNSSLDEIVWDLK